MDEYNQGWDPEVKQYFRKIANSFAVGALWLLLLGLSGFAFGLAVFKDVVRWYNLVYYGVLLISLSLLLLYYYRLWRKKE
jgi:hypothetical protein